MGCCHVAVRLTPGDGMALWYREAPWVAVRSRDIPYVHVCVAGTTVGRVRVIGSTGKIDRGVWMGCEDGVWSGLGTEGEGL